MATAKAERLLNLVIALVNSPRYRSALWIRDKVAGYSDAPNDEAFFRTFERDKQELRELGPGGGRPCFPRHRDVGTHRRRARRARARRHAGRRACCL